ncbi:MAG: hypothetical protein CTY15_11585 [Methylocystis sp.]|nr:MAG: hypothetical protein CTY15_11585 [Methylocystis sp.]
MRNLHLAALSTLLFSLGAAMMASGFTLLPAIASILCFIGVNAIFTTTSAGELLERPVEWPWFAQCLTIALLWCVIGGQGHFIFAKDDWLYRDAVLADIALRWLPVVYADGSDNWLLRAPLGMYLLPGGVGHLFGLRAAHLAQLLQNSVILGVTLYLPTLVWPRRRLVFVALFIAFSGLDVIPVLLKTGGASLLVNLSFWSDHWQYSSNVTQLVWSPNHTLPGWFFAALAVLYLKGEIDLAALAAASVPLALWSPLTLAGAAALFLFFLVRAPRDLLSLRFAGACGSGLAFLPILAYLAADAGEVPHEWLVFAPGFFEDYVLFILFALAQVFLLAFFRERIAPWFRGALFFSVALLLVIPAYSVGYMNDFSQRAPIVPRALLAFGFDALIIDLMTTGPALALVGALAIVLVGAMTPALEIYDAVASRAFPPGDCNLITVHKKLHPRNYLSTYLARLSALPEWMTKGAAETAPLRDEARACWPGRPYGEKLFNWLKPESRIWLRAPRPEDLVDPTAPK